MQYIASYVNAVFEKGTTSSLIEPTLAHTSEVIVTTQLSTARAVILQLREYITARIQVQYD